MVVRVQIINNYADHSVEKVGSNSNGVYKWGAVTPNIIFINMFPNVPSWCQQFQNLTRWCSATSAIKAAHCIVELLSETQEQYRTIKSIHISHLCAMYHTQDPSQGLQNCISNIVVAWVAPLLSSLPRSRLKPTPIESARQRQTGQIRLEEGYLGIFRGFMVSTRGRRA